VTLSSFYLVAIFHDSSTAESTSSPTGTGRWSVVRRLSCPLAVAARPPTTDLTNLVPAQDDLARFQKGNFVRMDPPRHRKLRGLVSQAFTPRMVAGLEPRIAEVTTELLDATGGGERLDLIESLAYPLPVIVIAELLGIPSTDRPTFRRWADTLTCIDPASQGADCGLMLV
jgi:cytochrome P450